MDMPATALKFSQFVDLLMTRLYELDHQQGDRFYDLNALAAQIREAIPPGWVFDAGKVLQTRGLAECLFTYGGIQAQLTGEGRLYVEEGRGITKEVSDHPENYFNVTVIGDSNQVAAVHGQSAATQSQTLKERAPAFRVLQEIERTLNSDQSLDGPRKLEAGTLLNLLRIQLEKEEPDRSLVGALLDSLGRTSSIAGVVANLVKILNG
jgi:hypothetical protein